MKQYASCGVHMARPMFGRYVRASSAVGMVSAFLLSFTPVHAQNLSYFGTLFGQFGGVIEIAVPVLVALALALFIWGGVVFVFSAGDDTKRKEGQKRMIWGIVGLFVIVSVWGLVQLFQVFFGADGDLGTIVAPGIPGAQ